MTGHSYNVFRKLYMNKDWEGRNSKTKAKYMIYVSVKKDTKNIGWPSKAEIEGSRVYCLFQILGFTTPGRETNPITGERFRYDWNLKMLHRFDDISNIIYIPEGVGRGWHYANDQNPHLIPVLKKIQKLLRNKIT